jgi:hypothetical protein
MGVDKLIIISIIDLSIEGGSMTKRLYAFGIASILVISLAGCGGDETDEQELMDAQNLLGGLMLMNMMVNPGTYTGSKAPATPPPFWTGPDSLDVPEGNNYLYYEYTFPLGRIPFDSAGITIDSLRWLVMLTPDIWDSVYEDSLVISIDTWLMCILRDIWFHTIISIPDSLHVTGDMKWNWDQTYFQYAYDVSTIDESAEINITTSSNLGLSAHFLFDEVGAGSLEDNWGKFQNTTFVKYEFFAEPDEDGYDGYYQLLSEAWNIDHYFVLTDPGT